MTELTDLNDTDALNTAVTSQSTEGNVANMGNMDNLFQATLGMLSRFRNANIFRLRDNTDKTKLLAFDLSGLTTATTRTLKVPNQSGSIITDDGIGNIVPATNDGGRLGQPATSFSDLFLASGGVIGWDNFDVSITHSTNSLSFAGASSGYIFSAAVAPSANDAAALGSGTLGWSDIYLASGGLLNWNNGTYTITQSGTQLNFSGNIQTGTYSGLGATAGINIVGDNGSGEASLRSSTTLTTAATHHYFANPNGAVGSISTSGSATTYATSSDHRRKPIQEALTGFWARINKALPKRFQWDTGEWSNGFVAHEFAEAGYVESVIGEKDAVDENGAPIYQSMQASSAEAMADVFAALQDIDRRLKAAGL